jgi:phage terminase large subunit GpA-like protein
VPYLREVMDAVSDPLVEQVVVQAASQIGKTELLLGVIGYFADQDPSPILLVHPTEIAMGGFSRERVEPMFRASPALAGKLSESLRDKANTVMLRQFPGGYLACGWATSSVSLASRPIRVLLGDELDRWPESTGRDGDPWSQAVQRTSNFHNRKIVAVSTPTIEGLSAISRLFDDSDQRRFHLPCPRCGERQVLEWGGVIYKRDDGEHDLDDVHYRCAHCKGRIEERERPAMLAAGEWRADSPGHHRRGYQLSALYSPWVRWRELAAEWIRATADRDKRGLQEFVNLRLGETWTEESERISVEALEKNREAYDAEIPDGVLLVTAGVDVQDNRLEAVVVGWGVGKESWGISYAVIAGDTSTPDPWHRLDAFLARTWSRPDGRALALWCSCVDSGGHRTQDVYEFCRARLARNVFAVKGRAGSGLPIAGKATTSNQLRIPLHPVGVDTAKEAIYSRLALTTPGPGYCHFPTAREAGFDDEFFKGLVSEQRVTKIRAGRRSTEWKQIRARNEPLDCTVYATAALELIAPDFAALAAAEALARGAAPKPAAPAPRRRVVSKGVDW